MFTFPTRCTHTQRQRGFSLIEVMIGAAIALIGMVVIFQVLTVWEERKRTTSAGSDAQVAGALAMYSLERDLKLAGFGFGMSTAMGCDIVAFDTTSNAAITGTAAQPVFRLYPVEILPGAGAAADEIRVLYGNSSSFASNLTFTTSSVTSKRAQGTRVGFQFGDLVVASGNAPPQCALVEITGHPVPNPPLVLDDGVTILHENGAYTNYLAQNVNSRYNPAAGSGAEALVPALSSGVLNNLGPNPRWNIWRIQPTAGGTVPRVLAWSDFLHTPNTWSEVAEGIISLKAQYGYDDNGDNKIECPNTAATPVCEWVNTLAAPPLTAPIAWRNVRAVRVALLARSQQFEKNAVTIAAPKWFGFDFVMTNVDGTADNSPGDTNDWRHYRYRVYQQVIPLRNVIWGTSPS